nr:MAG TPA: hypothetical protein [Bacteriophage sp.]
MKPTNSQSPSNSSGSICGMPYSPTPGKIRRFRFS